MAEKSSKKNIFQKIGQVFKEVRQELKKSVWPTKEKLKATAAVVLAVILFFAVFLSFISIGGRWVLDKANFYDEVEPTATTAAVTAVTEPVAVQTEVAETEAASETEEVVETEAAEETTAESEG